MKKSEPEPEAQVVEIEHKGTLHAARKVPEGIKGKIVMVRLDRTVCGQVVENGTSVPLWAWGIGEEYGWCRKCGRAVAKEVERLQGHMTYGQRQAVDERQRELTERLVERGVIAEDAA